MGVSMSEFLTLEQVREMLGVDYKTIWRAVHDGRIPASKVGRVLRVRASDLDEYLERQKVKVSVPAEPARCSVCGKAFLSALSLDRECEVCGAAICQACWAIKKQRRCAGHGAPSIAASPDSGFAVSRVLARRAEEDFIREFAERLEAIDELVDPITNRRILLRDAEVRHELIPGTPHADEGPGNLISRFLLKEGGQSDQRAVLSLEARFIARIERLAKNGADAEPIGAKELREVLLDVENVGAEQGCYHVSQLGSPTGWDPAAKCLVTAAESVVRFRAQRVGVCLHDLMSDKAVLAESDDRLRAFRALVAPERMR